MDKKKEITLQRLSRIGSLTDAKGDAQEKSPEAMKGRPVGAPSIEAVLGGFMTTTRFFANTNESKRKSVSDKPQSIYDMLDENRCSGFLLYSYDKNGAHSVLGENVGFNGKDIFA